MSLGEPYRFVAMVHSSRVAGIVRKETRRMGRGIDTFVTSYESAEADAARLLNQGYEALVCHGGFRTAIYRLYPQATVFIDRSDVDLLKALLEARSAARDVILTAHADESRDFELMEELTGVRVHPVRYATGEELAAKLRELVEQGVRVAVGGGGTARLMARLGGRTFLDEPRPSNIRSAISRAVMLVNARRREHSHLENLKEVMKYVKEGVVCVSEDRRILFHNDMALKLLEADGPSQLPRFFAPLLIDAVFAEARPKIDVVATINGKRLLVNTFPLRVNAGTERVVAFVHDALSLQNITHKIRSELYKKGFAARYTSDDIKGSSPAVARLRETIRRYGPTDSPVAVQGETGSGKELVAHALHAASPRACRPFVAVNCSALPEALLESELFGYEEGAFTGARKGGKPGLFELAHQGTLFLDEVDSISPAMQVRLLRVLEAGEIMRLGGDRITPVDVRVVSASHEPLRERVRRGAFRPDLYYRLVGLNLHVPPLRDRREDILPLARIVLHRHGRKVANLPRAVRRRLREYAWPGNVRELFSVMENACLLLDAALRDVPGGAAGPEPELVERLTAACFEEVFGSRDAFPPLRGGTGAGMPEQSSPGSGRDAAAQGGTLREQLAEVRAAILAETIRACRGNRKRAAQQLGLSYTTLRRLLADGAARSGEEGREGAWPRDTGGDQ